MLVARVSVMGSGDVGHVADAQRVQWRVGGVTPSQAGYTRGRWVLLRSGGRPHLDDGEMPSALEPGEAHFELLRPLPLDSWTAGSMMPVPTRREEGGCFRRAPISKR